MILLPQPVVYAPLSRTDFVRYAGASGDFNPLHHDHAFAASAGMPDVMGHGMLSAGMLASAVDVWFGPGNVVRYGVRFLSPIWPGDRLMARCVSIEHTAEQVTLSLSLERSQDDVVVSGTASVRTPPS